MKFREAMFPAIPALAVMLCMLPATAAAQEEQGAVKEAADADTSQRVDESEESFRARMELREQRFRDQQHSNTTFSYSTSREGKLANLPPESQEHIRAQLRDMVIESRLWKPGEDLSAYPYEPSPAAKRDPGLARQERDAWVEQLQKYQEREAAAHAADAGEAAGRQGARPGDDQAANPGQAGAAENAGSKTGATENALDFLQQRGMAGAASAPADPGGALAESPSATALADSAGEGENASQAGEPGEGERQAEQQGEQQGEPAEQAPAGTVDIADLRQIEFAVGADAAEQTRDATEDQAMTLREVTPAEAEPGTLGIEDLRQLDLQAAGAEAGKDN